MIFVYYDDYDAQEHGFVPLGEFVGYLEEIISLNQHEEAAGFVTVKHDILVGDYQKAVYHAALDHMKIVFVDGKVIV